MMGKTHQLGGVSAGVLTATTLYIGGQPLVNEHPELIPAIIAGGWLGGMIPDIDHPNATISNVKVLGIPFLKPLAWLINALFGHRGATHTIWALWLTTLPFLLSYLFIPPEAILIQAIVTLFGFGYAAGYLSHLVLDALTPSGTPMFWPLPDVHLGKLPTGRYDGLVRVAILLITVSACWGMLYFSGQSLTILSK